MHIPGDGVTGQEAPVKIFCGKSIEKDNFIFVL
jgi:hypothetical protein